MGVSHDSFGLIKTLTDAHTMGIYAAQALLEECGYTVYISTKPVEYAVERIEAGNSQKVLLDWISTNNLSHIGFSYRLDPKQATDIFGRMLYVLRNNGYYNCHGAIVRSVFFAGLPEACDQIDKEYEGLVKTFRGGESSEETLLKMGIPLESIPTHIQKGCQYDKELLKFGKKLINDEEYTQLPPYERKNYPEFGTRNDSLELRLANNYKNGFQPLIRAHAGPYSKDMSRERCLKEFEMWCQQLSNSGYLDILSIGSSQLTQSNFGENWHDKPNGGGVPVNSETEYIRIWKAARPMLVRTYSGTSNLRRLAEIHEKTINIAWHAFSLWWFDELDGRGANRLLDNLIEHFQAMDYAVLSNKPVETNVPHHFAFRGADDVTYIISEYLAAKSAKQRGVKCFILQNMLNTPRSTWGIQDLAKSRVMLKLVKELEDDSFKVILQTRAGLDFFKPDIAEAKAQLAAVTAMMDDIDPSNTFSPEIIHVVSYSEACFLATPAIIDDSIRITRSALNEYRKLKKRNQTPDVLTDNILTRQYGLEKSCRNILHSMENNIPDLYTPKGLYIAFVSGWLPVPELWSDSEEFKYAKDWTTRHYNGGVSIFDRNILVSDEQRINKCISNLPYAYYVLDHKYKAPLT